MYLQEKDYRVIIGDTGLRILDSANPETLEMAERAAIEEIASYVRPRYSVVKALENEKRPNQWLKTLLADITVYHLTATMPQKMGVEIREERYKRAIEALTKVAKGLIVPDLPPETDEQGKPCVSTLHYGSQPKLSNNW